MNRELTKKFDEDPEVLERFVEVGLERLEREDTDARTPVTPRKGPDSWRWLAAAVVLLGLGVVWTVQSLQESPAPKTNAGRPPVVRQDPEPAQVRTREDAERLPANTRAIRLFDADAELLGSLGRFRGLQRLEVVSPRIDATELCAKLAGITTLQGLHIETPMRDLRLGDLSRLPTLVRLSLHAAECDAENLRDLARCPALRELDLRECRGLTPDVLEAFEGLAGLRWLGLTPSHHLAISDLVGMPAPERFETLVLGARGTLVVEKGPLLVIGIEDVTHARSEFGLQGLAGFRNLRTLSLRPAREMPGNELLHLTKLDKLENLDLSGCFKVTGKDLQSLPPSIRRLDLSSTRWDAPLPHLVNLECLTATRTWKLTDAALAGTMDLPKLHSLRLRHCPALTAEAVRALERRRWRELDLCGQGWLGDDELVRLSAIQTIERLCVSGIRDMARLSLGDGGPTLIGGKSPITCKGIRALRNLESLSWLEMEDLQPMSMSDIRAIDALDLQTLGIGGTPLGGNVETPTATDLDELRTIFEGCDVRTRPEAFSLGRRLPTWNAAWADRLAERRS